MAIEIVDFPIKHGGSFHSYVSLPEGIYHKAELWELCLPTYYHKISVLLKLYIHLNLHHILCFAFRFGQLNPIQFH